MSCLPFRKCIKYNFPVPKNVFVTFSCPKVNLRRRQRRRRMATRVKKRPPALGGCAVEHGAPASSSGGYDSWGKRDALGAEKSTALERDKFILRHSQCEESQDALAPRSSSGVIIAAFLSTIPRKLVSMGSLLRKKVSSTDGAGAAMDLSSLGLDAHSEEKKTSSKRGSLFSSRFKASRPHSPPTRSLEGKADSSTHSVRQRPPGYCDDGVSSLSAYSNLSGLSHLTSLSSVSTVVASTTSSTGVFTKTDSLSSTTADHWWRMGSQSDSEQKTGSINHHAFQAECKRDSHNQAEACDLVCERAQSTIGFHDAQESNVESDLDEPISLFYGKALGCSVKRYVLRMVKYGRCSMCNVIMGFIYIERIKRDYPELTLSARSFQRLLLTAVMVASKKFDDIYFSNKHWAGIGELSLPLMNKLELALLGLLNFACNVKREEYDDYVASLSSCAMVLESSVCVDPGTPFRGIKPVLDCHKSPLSFTRLHCPLLPQHIRLPSDSSIGVQSPLRGNDLLSPLHSTRSNRGVPLKDGLPMLVAQKQLPKIGEQVRASSSPCDASGCPSITGERDSGPRIARECPDGNIPVFKEPAPRVRRSQNIVDMMRGGSEVGVRKKSLEGAPAGGSLRGSKYRC